MPSKTTRRDWVAPPLKQLLKVLEQVPPDKVYLVGYVDDKGIIQRLNLKAIQTEAEARGAEKVYDDWETAIRFSEDDEDEVIEAGNGKLSQIVMENHLRMSKEELLTKKQNGNI
jgi:hypothetical protein